MFFYAVKVVSLKKAFFLSAFLSTIWLVHFALYQWQKVYMMAHSINGIVLCLLATLLINKEFFNTSKKVWTNPLIVICFGILLQYLFFGLETLMMFLTEISANIRASIFRIYEYVNAFSYLLFAYGLWLNKKRVST